MNSKGPQSVSLAIVCPSVITNAIATPTDVGIPIAIALAVIIFVLGIAYSIRQYFNRREAIRQQKRKHQEEVAAAAKHAMQQLEEAAKHAEDEAKKAEAEQERERRLRHELQENIANTAHDIKSPTTALGRTYPPSLTHISLIQCLTHPYCSIGLAVESLLDTLDTDQPVTEAERQRAVETLHGMAHTISAMTMIINRSVDACKSSSGSDRGRGFFPNLVPVDLEHIMDSVMAFSKWQAEGTGIEVVMEPLPHNLPDEVMMDEKWLKDDLLCLAGNAVKYSRRNQEVPALIRIAIVPSTTVEEKANHSSPSTPSVQFSFIDSGYPLPEEKLFNIFNRPVHSERMQTGGMGLGLFCLREHIEAMQVMP